MKKQKKSNLLKNILAIFIILIIGISTFLYFKKKKKILYVNFLDDILVYSKRYLIKKLGGNNYVNTRTERNVCRCYQQNF